MGAPPEPAAKPAGAGAPPARRQRVLLAILAALLVLCAIGLAAERTRSARLEDRVASLSGELDATRATLDAYETRLGEVRNAVARLNALVQRDPAAPAPEPTPGN